MGAAQFDDLHTHATWGPVLRPELVEGGRLHRHRISDHGTEPRFTTWEHNGPNHTHRLPGGAWTRPRIDLRPPRDETPALGERRSGSKEQGAGGRVGVGQPSVPPA